ncbi:MAG: hypothetical protein IKW61_02130, partial [Bacteroidaceae bacterium]|nr:hypothetical protein [Bacteroidaceae bacterium]
VIVGNRTEWSYGRFGRFQGMSQNLSYTFNNKTLSRLFSVFKSDKPQEAKELTQEEIDAANKAQKELMATAKAKKSGVRATGKAQDA